MGLPMARNLLGAGFPLVVWNRTAERCTPLVDAGARAAAEPAELAAADVVVTMVSDGQAARSVLVESGLLDELRPGSVVLEMSTIGPTAAAELAAEALRHDVHLLDAPVSGSVSVAEAAQLFAMVGGDRDAYELATPVLDAMTKGHVLLGPSGAGAAMKLAVNAMIAVTNESLAETLALAERFGIERERAYDVLAGGALASPFLLYKRGAFLHPDDGAGRVHDRADAEGHLLSPRISRLVWACAFRPPRRLRACSKRHCDNGLADADMASVISLLGPAPGSAQLTQTTTSRRSHEGSASRRHHGQGSRRVDPLLPRRSRPPVLERAEPLVRGTGAGQGRRGSRRRSAAGEPAARGHDARAPGVQEPAERDHGAAHVEQPRSLPRRLPRRRHRSDEGRARGARASSSTATSTSSTRACSPDGGGCTSKIRTATRSSSSRSRTTTRRSGGQGSRRISRRDRSAGVALPSGRGRPALRAPATVRGLRSGRGAVVRSTSAPGIRSAVASDHMSQERTVSVAAGRRRVQFAAACCSAESAPFAGRFSLLQ